MQTQKFIVHEQNDLVHLDIYNGPYQVHRINPEGRFYKYINGFIIFDGRLDFWLSSHE